MVLLAAVAAGMIEEDVFLVLLQVWSILRITSMFNELTHFRRVPYKEIVIIKHVLMILAQCQAIAGLIELTMLRAERNPLVGLGLNPLHVVRGLSRRKNRELNSKEKSPSGHPPQGRRSSY